MSPFSYGFSYGFPNAHGDLPGVFFTHDFGAPSFAEAVPPNDACDPSIRSHWAGRGSERERAP